MQPLNLLVCTRRRHLQHQVGEPVGGVKPAQRPCRRRHAGEPVRRCRELFQFGGKTFRGESVLNHPARAAGAFEHAGIGELILVDGVRQRHQDRGTADG